MAARGADVMSVIRGHGYGDSHEWAEGNNPLYPIGENGRWIRSVGGPTEYQCLKCGSTFKHHYHDIIDIFDAIKVAGISDKCPNANA